MTIAYNCQPIDGVLVVEASGSDDSLEEVQSYGLAVIDAAVRHGCTRVLCLENRLEYRIGTADIFEAASYIAEKAPHIARVAIVCRPADVRDARFWENVAVNRGLTVRMFLEPAEAERWVRA